MVVAAASSSSFVDSEFALARQAYPATPRRLTAEAKLAADSLFRSAIDRLTDPASTFAFADAR